jgi:hypothetical protein
VTAVVKDQVYVYLFNKIIKLKHSSFHTNSPYLIIFCFVFYLQIVNHIINNNWSTDNCYLTFILNYWLNKVFLLLILY